ncbi:hypothetical protein ACFJGX_19785 [Hydrogenophaga sp. UC242_50]|uniref:hypothetical protein n=1 Tax=Hydrogenophaga sp. UC242_50 TaxID=3350169 RepID=UPI0036D306A9
MTISRVGSDSNSTRAVVAWPTSAAMQRGTSCSAVLALESTRNVVRVPKRR